MNITPRLASIKLGDCPLFQLALVLVALDDVASIVVNADLNIG